jgi:formamidopyrimidine-DNA glycosylase
VPELPDVEVYRRRLARSGLRRTIARVRIPDRTVLRGASDAELTGALRGRQIVATGRRGKHLFACTSDEATMVMHFGMTGVLRVDERPDGPARYERLALEFTDGGVLRIVDPRKLGFVTVVDDVAAYCREHDLGPDALDLTLADLRRLMHAHRGGVKAVLMNQSLLAGIGNIYSDEILFAARIDPRRPACSLDEAEVRRLHRQMSRVLRLAADRGADASRFPGGWLLRHREDGAACPRGDGEITKVHLAGRGAYYCPGCQR